MQNVARKKVIAGVIKKDGLFLLAQRGKQDASYKKWEFPGGKVEEGESDQQCLVREFKEECNIVITVCAHICDVPFMYQDLPYVLRAYWVESFTGEIELHEHLQIHWVTLENLSSYSVPEPEIPLIAYLQKK